MIVIAEPVEFVWDEGNKNKNWEKHKVSIEECEQAFFDKGRKIYKDIFHSNTEERFLLLGKTEENRLLYIVFTTRAGKMRVISARDINKKERKFLDPQQSEDRKVLELPKAMRGSYVEEA